MPAKGLPTIPCPRCGAFERIGTEKCFACGSLMQPVEESRGFDPTRRRADDAGQATGRAVEEDWTSSPSGLLDLGGSSGYGDSGGGFGRGGGGDGWAPVSDGPADARPPSGPPPEGPFNAAAGYGYGQGYGGYGTGYGTPPPGYGYGYAHGYSPQQEKGATTALVLGIVAFVCCGVLLGPAAIYEGSKARRRIRESNGMLTGDAMALAGMILGAVTFVLNVAVIILQIVLISSTPTARYR